MPVIGAFDQCRISADVFRQCDVCGVPVLAFAVAHIGTGPCAWWVHNHLPTPPRCPVIKFLQAVIATGVIHHQHHTRAQFGKVIRLTQRVEDIENATPDPDFHAFQRANSDPAVHVHVVRGQGTFGGRKGLYANPL